MNNHFSKSNFNTNAIMNDSVVSQTPYILEERQMNITQMDVFSRLMKDRSIFITSDINPDMASIVVAQLLYLDSISNDTITIYISSPGGCVISGNSIIDTMNNIESKVSTINIGMCASMGAVILASGEKGLRKALKSSTTMIHQASSGTRGHVNDQLITLEETKKHNFLLLKRLSKVSNFRSFQDLLEYANRDVWLNSSEVLLQGFIDEVILTEGDTTIEEDMEGYKEYKEFLDNEVIFKKPNLI